MRRKAKAIVLPLQQAEFDALPDSVQRKYFSSLERLQIRQHSLDEQNASGCSSRASSSGQLCPSLNHHQHQHQHLHHAAPLAPRRLQLSQPEADFFLALPEKLRRLHFSRQEQLLLESCCARRHDDDLERARQRFSDFHFGFSQQQQQQQHHDDNHIEPDACADHRGRSRRRSLSHSSLVSPTQASFRSVAVQDEDPSSDASSCTDSWNRVLDQLDHLNGMTTRPFRSTSTSHDVRRTMSLSHAPVRHYTASSAMILGGPSTVLMADPPVYSTSSTTKHQRAHSSSFSMSGRSSLQTSTPLTIDPEATHYQDPEARRKLRMYLASPQKFDEAIEFGFPSSAENDAAAPHYQLPPITNHSRKFSRDMQTFLKDGKLSFFEEGVRDNQGLDSDEEASLADADSPVTPSSTGLSFSPHSRQVSHSKMSSEGSPGFSSGCNFNREMTLRMTLTRPDLRADEDQLYGWQSPPNKTPKDDPLALEDLILTDDMNGTKGPFYVKPKSRESLVTRMLKRASWKGR